IALIIVYGYYIESTLYYSHQMIVYQFNYHFNEPKRFDIVIFHATEKKDYIKRVIGLPGEHVEVKNDQLYIAGKEKDAYFLNKNDEEVNTEDFTLESLPGNYKEIPEGKVFVLGDNRHNSTDSRVMGLIDIDQIVGKASFIYWPFDRMQFVK